MNKIIKPLIDEGIITSSQARSIEIFIIGTGLSFVIGLLDLLQTYVNGDVFEFKVFISVFITTTTASIIAGFRKYFRDIQTDLKKD